MNVEQRNVIKCNRCAIDNCPRTVHIADASKCSSFLTLDNFKRPILNHLLSEEHKINAVTAVLSSFRLRIREINYYPFFKLEVVR